MSIRTVLGDIAPDELGVTNYHEHLFQVTPLLPGEELDDEAASQAEFGHAVDDGLQAMVDATPIGLGRRPATVARLSAALGLHVVATAGVHHEGHYPASHWIREVDDLGARLLAELVDGQPIEDGPSVAAVARDPDGEPVRAGILKGGIGYWSISPFERRTLDALSAAHARTGAPIMVHLEEGSAAHEVLDLLAAGGVAEQSVILAHVDRSPDRFLFSELAARGAWLGCDGAARLKKWPESMLIDCLAATVEAGHGDRVLLGGDVARRSRYLAHGGMPGVGYLTRRFVPRLRGVVGPAAVRRFLVDNPATALQWRSV
ncbi:MAG: phosphotriesterase family protein [Propionibacteriaceae bacterium]